MIAAVALSAALLLPATAEPPTIETRAAEVTIPADGRVHEVAFEAFASAPDGVELALYSDNVAVVSGGCEAGWGVNGVEVRATTPGTCEVSVRPHDPLSGDTAAPAQITVTAEVPTSAPAPGDGPAADAPPAASSSHRPVQAPGDSPLPLVVAWVVLVVGWGAAIAVNRRDREGRLP